MVHQKADCTELEKVKEQLEMIQLKFNPTGKRRREANGNK